MKILLAWPYCQGEHDDPPDLVAVLIPTKKLCAHVAQLMKCAAALEKEIPCFVHVGVRDRSLLFIGVEELRSVFTDAVFNMETGQFHCVDLAVTELALVQMETARTEEIELCVARVEKERIEWKFYIKDWEIPVYAGALGKKELRAAGKRERGKSHE